MWLTYLRQSLLIVHWSCFFFRQSGIRFGALLLLGKNLLNVVKILLQFLVEKKYRFNAFTFSGRPLGAYYECCFNFYRLSHRHRRALYILTCLWFPLRILLPRASAKPNVATISGSAGVKSQDASVLAECVRKPLVVANALSGRDDKIVKTHTYTCMHTHQHGKLVHQIHIFCHVNIIFNVSNSKK